MLPRRPHPESYQISFPEYLNITPDGLRRRWSSQPAGPQAVVLFYDQGPLVADQFILSNWFLSTAFAFCVPAWAEHEWLTSQGLPTQVEATFGEKPLMLLKAAVMRDATSYRAILEAATPAETKALGRQVRGFDQSLWSKRVCAVTMAVVRARAAALPELKALLLSHAGQYFAEASPRDTVHGIGLAVGDAKARQPKLWKGSNVLGWAYMTCAAELAGDARRRGKRKVSTGQTDGAFQEAIAEDMLNAEDKLRGGLASLGEGPAAKELTVRRQVGETKSPRTAELQSPPCEALAVRVPLEHCVSITACAAAQALWAYCVIITTLLEPLVLAHVDGDTQLAVPIQKPAGHDRKRDDRMLDHAEQICRSVAPDGSTALIPAGLTMPERAPVVAAPVPIAPPPNAIVRTPKQRKARQAAGASFLFLTVAALAGTPAYRVAAPALARVNSFVRPALDLQEASLAGGVLANAARFHFGGRETFSLVRGIEIHGSSQGSAAAHCDKVHAHERELVDALRSVPGDSDVARYQRESAEAVHFLNLDSVPDELCRPATEVELTDTSWLPFRHDCPVPVTDYVPRKPPQPATCQECATSVTSCSDFVRSVPECSGLLQEWWANATHDLARLSEGSRLEGVRRTRTISLTHNCFIPCARDCWFDCRQERTSGVQVLDYHQPIESQLTRSNIRTDMAGWPDQALASYVEYGATYPDLPHALTLGPQLLSLANGFDRAQKELAELVGKRWYGQYPHFPFFPFHMCPKGCTERKLEDRPRPTTDASHPPCDCHGRASVFNSAGEPVYSPNWYARRVGLAPLDEPDCLECGSASFDTCVGCADGCVAEDAESPCDNADGNAENSHPSWWTPLQNRKRERLKVLPPQGWQSKTSAQWDENFWNGYATWGWYGGRTPEFKPNVQSILHDQNVLRTPAFCLKQPVLQACDDWKNAFNHIRVRPQDWPKSVTMAYSRPYLRADEPPHVLFTAEYVLGFGHTDNSGVFQRWASFVQHLVMREMDRLERPRIRRLRKSHPCFDKWASKREALSRQTGRVELRLYTMHTYSDDPSATCVGVECVLNWLEAWFTVNRRVNMIPAVLAKRSLGTQVKWLGALPNPHLGYLTVPQDKILRVQGMIDEALAGTMPKSSYRSLMGFLEWFAWIFVHPRSRMWGLYAPLRGVDDGTAVVVQPNPRMTQQLNRWREDLWQVAGVAIEAALPRRRRLLPKQTATFFVSQDAAKEGTDTPGIAGWCHGWTWAWFYPKSWLQLPIAVLEFLAFAVSVIQFEPLLREAPQIVFETDSISAAFNLEKMDAHAPLMQIAFQLLQETVAWVSLIVEAGDRERAVRHVKGKLNIFADAESRGHHLLVSDLCLQLGIRRHEMPLSDASQRYLEQFAVEASPLVPLALLGLDVSPACDDHDGPTLLGYLPLKGTTSSPQRPSSADRTLQMGQPLSYAAAVVPANRAALPAPHDIVLRHLQPALQGMLRDGIAPSEPQFRQLQAVCAEATSRRNASTSGSVSVAPDGSTSAAVGAVTAAPRLREASDDYSLTGMQVATGLPSPHPQQPGAAGYAPDSRYALNPPQAVWDAFLERRQKAMEDSFPDNTKNANDCHWRFWKSHCAIWGCQTPIRDNYESMSGRDPLGQRDELNLAASFIDSRYFTMQPRKYGTIPKVESAFQSYLHVVRVMSMRSIPALPQKELRVLVRGMTNAIIDELGVEVVLPSRKQPINNRLHNDLLRLPDGLKLGPYTYYEHSHIGNAWRRLLGVLNRSGFRKAEWSARRQGESTTLTFRQVAYCFDGSDLPVRRPTRETLAAAHTEAWLYIYPPRSKCDPDGSKFGTKAIPFKRELGDETVQLFLDEELRMHEANLTDAQRDATPVFTSAPQVPFHRSGIDAALKDAVNHCTTGSVANHTSWHSYRIRLAVLLKADGRDNPTIQAVVRWNTDQAIAVYARFEREYYWGLLQSAARHDATSVQFTALPEIDEQQRIITRLGLQKASPEEVERQVYALSEEAPPAFNHARPSTRPHVPAPPSNARATQHQMPEGWRRVDSSTAQGRIIPSYHGPNGERARSLVQAISTAQLAALPPSAAQAAQSSGRAAGCSPPSLSLPAADRSPRAEHSSRRAARRSPPASQIAQAADRSSRAVQSSRPAARCSPPLNAQAADRSPRAAQSSRPAAGCSPPSLACFSFVPGRCGTFGCELPDNHIGLCSNERASGKRRRNP